MTHLLLSQANPTTVAGTAHQSAQSPYHRLSQLVDKAARAPREAGMGVDWKIALKPRRWIPRRTTARIVSQVLHGERIAMRLCDNIYTNMTNPVARAFLRYQREDELRHVSAYKKYINRLGDITPAGTAMQIVEEGANTAPGGAIGRMVICHLILESEAIRLHGELADLIACPLLDAINNRVGPDEARHVAFGKLFLKSQIDSIDPDTRAALGDHAKRVWQAAAEAIFEETIGTRLIPKWLVEDRLEHAWPRHQLALDELGLSKTGFCQ